MLREPETSWSSRRWKNASSRLKHLLELNQGSYLRTISVPCISLKSKLWDKHWGTSRTPCVPLKANSLERLCPPFITSRSWALMFSSSWFWCTELTRCTQRICNVKVWEKLDHMRLLYSMLTIDLDTTIDYRRYLCVSALVALIR